MLPYALQMINCLLNASTAHSLTLKAWPPSPGPEQTADQCSQQVQRSSHDTHVQTPVLLVPRQSEMKPSPLYQYKCGFR